METLEPRLALAGDNADDPFHLANSSPPLPSPVPSYVQGDANQHTRENPTAEGEAGQPISLRLTGVFPRQVQIVDLNSSRIVYRNWHSSAQVALSDLPDGDYVLKHAASGEVPQALHISLQQRVLVATVTELKTIHFEGNLPRKVRVTDTENSRVVFDNWHYSSDFDPTVFPAGSYLVQHAASGEGSKTLALLRGLSKSNYASLAATDIDIAGSLPRRLQITDRSSGRLISDFWLYDRELDLSHLPGPGAYELSHAASGEFWRRDIVVVGADLPSHRLHVSESRLGTLDVDWGSLGDSRAFHAEIELAGRKLFSAWHYDTHLSIAVQPGDLQLRVFAPSRRTTVVDVPITAIDIYEVSPIRIATRTAEGGHRRSDLFHLGQYQVAPLDSLTALMGCSQHQADHVLKIRCGSHRVQWREGGNTISVGDAASNRQILPLVPYRDGPVLYFPVRILAEALGWNTRYDPASGEVSVFKLKSAARSVSLQLEQVISGSDLDFSYFMMVHETQDYLYLVHDHARAILRFNKPAYTYEKLSLDPAYGYVLEFTVHPDGTIYAASSSGALVRWTGHRFEPVLGTGTRELSQTGEATTFAEFKSPSLSQVVTRSDGRILYLLDANTSRLYEADLTLRRVRVLATGASLDSSLDLELYRDKPLVVAGDNQLVWVHPENLAIERSSCFTRLFDTVTHRVHSVRYLPASNLWIVPSASSRVMVEARLHFDSEAGACRIERQTYTGDKTAFLNGLGSIDPAIDSGDRVLVIDSDGFNVVDYRVPAKVSLITNDQLLRHAQRSFLAPTNVAEHGGSLYILGNVSHQVARYDFSTGRTEPFLGTGTPVRSGVESASRWNATIGYPNDIEFLGDQLWVADHYSRRLLAVAGDIARQPFSPVSDRVLSGIVSFDVDPDRVLLVDHAFGQVMEWRPGRSQPEHLAGFVDPRSRIEESEKVRRSASLSSTHEMTSFSTVQFGLPISVESLPDGRFVVTDLYRHGMWLLDPRDRSVKRAAGLNANTDYHFGGFTGNVGLEATELRLGSPVAVERDGRHRLLVVAGGYQGAAVLMRDDFSKSCLVTSDIPFEYVSQATFLSDGRFAVVDTPRNKIYIFKPPSLGCLETPAS